MDKTQQSYRPPKADVRVLHFESPLLTGSIPDWGITEIPGEEFED